MNTFKKLGINERRESFISQLDNFAGSEEGQVKKAYERRKRQEMNLKIRGSNPLGTGRISRFPKILVMMAVDQIVSKPSMTKGEK